MSISGKYQAVETTAVTLTPPWQVVLSAWAILCALLLVFGRDIGGWAEASERPAVQRYLLPAAVFCSTAAERSGIDTWRDTVESAVHRVYDNPVYVASRGEEALGAAPSIGFTLGRRAEASEALQGGAKPRVTRILLVGASSIQEELGAELERQLELLKGIDVRREGRYSTGLARPDFFDWTPELKKLIAEYKPDLVLAQWGGNDCQGLATKEGTFVAKTLTPEWDAEYAKRVKAIIGVMRDGGCQAAMIGMPSMRNKSFNEKTRRLNEVTSKAVAEAGGIFLPTWDLTVDAGGKYKTSISVGGKDKMMRAGDGTHFTNYGAEYVAGELVKRLAEHCTLGAG